MFFNKNSAYAVIKGSRKYPKINGTVSFDRVKDGVLIKAKISGLPEDNVKCYGRIFAMHIHSGGSCSGNANDPFFNAGTHYNPKGCEHPYHAGDLPPLFSNNGTAEYSVVLNKFTIDEIIGKTVIVHDKPDDFTTQPSGNSGNKIACGVIKYK